MDIMEMKKKDFKNLPHREWNEDIGEFDSLVIIPLNHKHDSGFMCMDFVAVNDNEPICLLSGCSDVIHIDGIGGYGKWISGEVPRTVIPKSWSIDCIPCGYLRIFANNCKLTCGHALSSFEIWSEKITRG